MEIIFIATVMEIAIVASLLILFFIIRYLLKKGKDNTKKVESINKEVISKAIILSAENTGHIINNSAQLKLQLQIIPEKGRNFVVEVKQAFTAADINIIRTGSKVMVRYNPSNIKEIFLVKAA